MTVQEEAQWCIQNDGMLAEIRKKIKSGRATYADTAAYSARAGKMIGALLSRRLPEIPLDEREQLCVELLHGQYIDINAAVDAAQSYMDKALGIRLTPQHPAFNGERAHQIGSSTADPTVPQETQQRRAGSATETAVKSMHDDRMKAEAKSRSRLGLDVTIERKGNDCCAWCAEVAGRYPMGEEPEEVYHRHDNCCCTVTYENGRQRQDVWSKRAWEAPAAGAGAKEPERLTPEQAAAKEAEHLPKRLTSDQLSAKIASEESPRKSKDGRFDVNWTVIQSPEYSAKFSKLSSNPDIARAIETRARWALNNRTGTSTEEIYAVSLSDGREVARITSQNIDSGIRRTASFSRRLHETDSRKEPVLLLHNHPRGLPPSIADINALLEHQFVSGITVGHNGTVYYYTRPSREISEFDWAVELRRFKEFSEATSMEKALETLSQKYGFIFVIL